MKTKRVQFLGLLLLCILGSVAAQNLLKRTDNEANVKTEAASRPATDAALAQIVQQRVHDQEDFALRALPATYARPESDWQNNEKIFYKKILSQRGFDTLLVPFQVKGPSFDRSTRSLMTAELSLAIAKSEQAKLPDSYSVAKALGDGQRQFKQEEVIQLAEAMGVKRIIWGYTGHDRMGKMHIDLEIQDKASTSEPWAGAKTTKRIENIVFTDEMAPIEAFEGVLPALLKNLGVDVTLPIFNQVSSGPSATELPASPKGLGIASDSPTSDAYSFLLYSALAPTLSERAKERFAEKAWLAQLRMSATSPDYKAVRARVHMALGNRLAAIHAIGAPTSDEERETLAALNGNLQEVRTLASRERNPLKRLIQKLDENLIGTRYGVIDVNASVETVKSLKLPGEVWPFIATRAFVGDDDWAQFDNIQLKNLLDYELSIKGYTLEEVAKEAMSVGDQSKLQMAVDLSVFQHGKKYVQQNANSICCQLTSTRPNELDYMELLQSFGQDNLLRRIYFLNTIQGKPDVAIAFANGLDSVYSGFPYYSVLRANAEFSLAQMSGGAKKESLIKSAYSNAFNAYYWEQGQSKVADYSRKVIEVTLRQDYGRYGNLYYTDIPFRPDTSAWSDGGNMQAQIDNQVAALKNATYNFNTLESLVSYYHQFFPNETRAGDLLKSIDGRFIGSPKLNKLNAIEALQTGNVELAESLYRSNVKLTPSVWSVYVDLGNFLLTQGKLEASAKVYLAYPGFKKGYEGSRVGVANNAYAAGSLFYWAGHPEMAKPFYAIAASQGTGAGSEMSSSKRLKLMGGDIQGAMAESLEEAQRYQDNHSYQDYLGLLHASGQSKYAWAKFGTLVQTGQGEEILASAMVGSHINALTDAEVVTWAKQSGLGQSGRHESAAATFLLEYFTTDRTPSAEAIDAIQNLDIARFKVDGRPGLVYRQAPRMPAGPNEHVVKSTLALFAEGYRAIKLKDFAAAKSTFDEASKLEELTLKQSVNSPLFYLPYYAFASVKTHDTTAIQALLGSIKVQERGFYYYLAVAVLESGKREDEKAFRSLNLARCFIAGQENWPMMSQHTYAEISEWIGENTGNPKIRAMTVDWAKKYQLMQPWLSWSYALEAKLTLNPVDRARAMSMARYLDPKSERLLTLKKSEIDEAAKALGKSNPFISRQKQDAKAGDL